MNTANKVANITALFWLMKIVATTLGETLGDYISMTLNLGYSIGIAITFIFFAAILLTQLSIKKYTPIIYWMVIVATTTLGTEISDFIDRTIHLGYALGSLLLVSLLFSTLFLWHKKYGNLKVYPISDRPKEIYYWIAILFSNSLGTAFGDFLSDNLGLSYLNGALITGAVILIVLLLHYYTKINQIVLFWIAFIFTRPFGATFGDFLTKPIAKGGLDLGRLSSSLVSIFILALLIYISNKNYKTSQIKMKKIIKFLVLFLLALNAISCNKGAGKGGNATLKGQVYAYNYSKSFVLSDSGYLGAQKVYIIYGDGSGVSDNTETDNNGQFMFPYLRKGKYQVYVFSKKLNNASLDSTVIQLCEIKTKNEIKQLPLVIVNTIK